MVLFSTSCSLFLKSQHTFKKTIFKAFTHVEDHVSDRSSESIHSLTRSEVFTFDSSHCSSSYSSNVTQSLLDSVTETSESVLSKVSNRLLKTVCDPSTVWLDTISMRSSISVWIWSDVSDVINEILKSINFCSSCLSCHGRQD